VSAEAPIQAATRRLDQWLWFARFAKTRSLAARLCSGGAVSINGTKVKKPGHAVRPGDLVGVRQGQWRRSVRIVDLGQRRGPAPEARGLYDEIEAVVRAPDPMPEWVPLLGDQ